MVKKPPIDFRTLRLRVPKVFLPGTAIRSFDFFSGREEQLTKATGAVYQAGRHILIFGETGVGKTSLAKVLVDLQQKEGFRVLETLTVNCDPSDDFTTLWRKIFRELLYTEKDGHPVYMDELLPTEAVFPDDIRYCLSRFREPILIALDEVDQLVDADSKKLLSATIKNLSDHSPSVTLMLVGVANTADSLIEGHRSIIRALIPVRMPRMSDEEIEEILNKGLYTLGMTMDAEARGTICLFARGFPYYAHSFGLHAGLKAIESERLNIINQDVFSAAADVALNAFDIHTAYSRATISPQSTSKHDMALLACAFARPDEQGFFPAASLAWPMSILLGRDIDIPRYNHYLEEFCDYRRGRVLEVIGGKGRKRYRFSDSLMQPYVIINAFGTGKLDIPKMMQILKGKIVTEETIH